MRKGLARLLAGVLATALIFSSGSDTLYAVQGKSASLSSVSSGTSVETQGEPQAVTPNAVVAQYSNEGTVQVKGSLEVMITAGMKVEKEQKFLVILKNEKGEVEGEEPATLPGSEEGGLEAPRVSVPFSGLEEGVYQLSVSGIGDNADRYDEYKQEGIVIQNLGYRIQLYTGKRLEGSGNLTQPRPGLLRLRDYTEEDVRNIVNAIDEGRKDPKYDLDGDGDVDLQDLSRFAKRFSEKSQEEDTTATVEKWLPLEAFESNLEGREVEGSIQDILKGMGGVSLASESGGIISEDNPVTVSFDLKSVDPMKMDGIVIQTPRNGDGAIEDGEITISYCEEDGTEREVTTAVSTKKPRIIMGSGIGDAEVHVEAEWKENGELHIVLGDQIAVKKVTLKITKTSGTRDLAKISRVEFVNDMASRIPDPVMNIPENLKADAGNKQFSLSWTKQSNVTAYEVKISCKGKEDDYRRTTANTITIAQFNKDKMVNNTEYVVSVQSLNGEWKSGFSKAISVIPKPNAKPKAPDNVVVEGGYRSVVVRWKELEDTDSYNVFFKKYSDSEFKKISGITACRYQFTDLEDDVKYLAYVTATNEIGEGPASLTAADKTLSGLVGVRLPVYKLINTSNGTGVLSKHIQSATINSAAQMKDSALDTGNSALGVFDNSYNSYMYCEDWDYGGAYPGADKGIITELDAVYSIGMITFAEPMDLGSYAYLSVFYWDQNNVRCKAANAAIFTRKSGNRAYSMIKFKEPIVTSKIQFGVGRYNAATRKITISEVCFYEYDSIEQDIMNLYQDSLHIVLRNGVTAQTIQNLQTRLDTKDSVSGEYHPEREALQKELDMAKKLLETGGLGDVVSINPNITAAKDSQISVGGMNAWQPLGVAAGAGEEIVVYVGREGMSDGANTSIRLIAVQHHAESSQLSSAISLKIGRNEITLPKISSTDVEKGGALYVEYTGNNADDKYAVRVSGGNKFPILNVYRISEAERTKRIKAYIEELNAYVKRLQTLHSEAHSGSKNEHLQYAYDTTTCILNTTDIVMDKMMLSIPASQVLAGLGSENREAKMANGIQAMDEMLTLFYQHKGLTNSFAEGTSADIISKNHIPYRYLNIRYMKMFAGAFMYAAGNHIGIEWGSTPGVVGINPVQFDKIGKYIGGQYFGWGIAHEIGHDINQGAYAHAEVTNNYFSILAQSRDTNDSVRFQYSNVFQKVTSNTVGYADNVFTQLGMYWQLHLAYDRGYNYKTYGTYQEIFDHLFFARVDSYARDAAAAPSPNGVKLTLDGGDRDQNFMRLASAAAKKDLTEFFIRWGMIPNDKTIAYVGQFEKETRAIYYQDDTARIYEMQNGTSGTIAGKSVVTATAKANNSEVTIVMKSSADAAVIQGYEIARVFLDQGKERREIAGFVQGNKFIDQAAFAANRVIIYEVTAIDKYMNRSAVYRVEPVKIKGDGLQDKTYWTVQTNMTSSEDKTVRATETSPCEAGKELAVKKVIDKNPSTTFKGSVNGSDPYIILELNQIMEIAALEYKLTGSGQAIGEYMIEISKDGKDYEKVKTGTLKKNEEMLYFEGADAGKKYIRTYDAAFVKLTALGQSGKELSISELELYGLSGDNIEFLSASGKAGIGTIKSDFVYDNSKPNEYKIPADSIVFTGTYKGNPAYNVVVLYDEKGEIVGGTDEKGALVAHQIILAPDPGNAMLGETSEGVWIYWIEPSANISAKDLPSKVRAELYRVDDALTNKGQRLVSDTMFEDVPKTLSPVTLSK